MDLAYPAPPVLTFCSSSQLLHIAQVCLVPQVGLCPIFWPLSWSNAAPLALHWTILLLALKGQAYSASLHRAAKCCFSPEVDLTSSALLHVWLNTKTSCVGPAHQAILAALSNSLSFVHPSASIHPMQKCYLQLFDVHCSIRCKHWITFDLQPDTGRIILGSSPLIASFVICYLATLSFTLHIAHPLHWDMPFNTMCHEIKCFLKIYYI